MSGLPSRLGVIGAGTMGAGIAQLGATAGIETVLHDPFPDALAKGVEGISKALDRGVERGRLTAEDAEAAKGRLSASEELSGLAGCDLVIEAAPERLGLKRDLIEQLSEICGSDAVLATNTSSIPVTALATAAANPANVVGMHFFNPAPVMKLVEVIAADQTGERALDLARATGEAMGKAVIIAADGPGFLVNRCGRPFYTEGLRLLQEGIATHDTIDRIYRLGGGYRMGPFELMDLVGIDTGYAVAQSFTELSFGEPRWKPNPIQARMVAAGRFGRKTGRGYYDYSQDPYRPDDPDTPDAAAEMAPAPAELVDCATGSLLSRSTSGVGFFRLPGSPLVELTRAPDTSDADAEAAERHFASQGLHTEWVQDAPGLVLGRVVAQIVNEGCFALGEGVGSEEDIDTGLKLGLNHPVGSMEWGRRLGFDTVLAILEGIWQERREERYRPAPTLLRLARTARD